jgi:hypothetical protein
VDKHRCCGERGGIAAATSGIPGVVFAGAQGGMLRHSPARTGRIVWEFNTAVEFQTKNGCPPEVVRSTA